MLFHGFYMVSDPDKAAAARVISPLGVPIFRAIWIASMVSNFGALIQSVGAAWMMTSLSGSARMVALVQASTVLPFMLFSLLAGAVADNLDRRKVMLTAQSFMLLVSALLAFAAWEGWLTPWLLLTFTFLIGCGTAMAGPAWQASVGDIVARPQLAKAVALNSTAFKLARTVGPAVGGAIVAAAGAATAFLVNAISYIGLIAVLLRWRRPPSERLLPPERLVVAMGAGLRYVAMSPNLRLVVARALLFGLSANAVSALMPIIARDLVKGGALTFGTLLGAFGVGAVMGGLGSSALRGRLSTETITRLAAVSMGVGTAGTALSTSLPLTLFALMLAGASWVMALSTFNITIQLASPRWVVARALSVYQMIAFGGMAVGAWVLGLVADEYGVSAALLAAAASQALVLLVGLFQPLPQVDDLNLDPLRLWQEPEIALPIEPRSGPVVITIEYRIASDRIVPFLASMNERRRIRRRDGAEGWSLLRDLHQLDLWVERYHVATWHDYVRHNLRRTQDDAQNSAVLHALQTEGIPYKVHRMIERQTGSLPELRRHEPFTADARMDDPTGAA